MEWVVDRVVRCHWPLRDPAQASLLQCAPRRDVSRHDRDDHGRRDVMHHRWIEFAKTRPNWPTGNPYDSEARTVMAFCKDNQDTNNPADTPKRQPSADAEARDYPYQEFVLVKNVCVVVESPRGLEPTAGPARRSACQSPCE